ncbi:phosphatase PAP2 family protein [Lewinella sp. LCG006]|uniref:phosphatase PAP2 family protein n=1 Tax=Lewinella sp. LCG006 TaxID=3231911 RepID=UPI00345FD1E6
MTAQNERGPYYLSLKREIIYSGSGLVGTVGAFFLHERIPSITASEAKQPNLTGFDKMGLGYNSSTAKNLSDQTLFTALGLPVLLLAGKESRRDISTIGFLYIETMLINQGITDLVKVAALRPRPYIFEENFPSTQILNSNDRSSFFSGHTSSTATASFFVARVFADYYPQSKLKPYVWGMAAALPALTGYLRIRAGRHYPSDVLVGYLVGGAVGYLVPTLHKIQPKRKNLSIAPGMGGLYLNYDF